MNPPAHRWRAVVWLGLAYLVVAAVGHLYVAVPHLLVDVAQWSALDLKYRFGEVAAWFAGNPVYGTVDGAVYPPASHVLLWPLLGWVSLEAARALWLTTMLVAAGTLAYLAYLLCAPAAPRVRLLVAGLAFAGYPLQQSIYVGQMGMHVVALAAVGCYVLLAERRDWRTDIIAALLLSASLVKPTLATPLVMCGLLAAQRWRPALLVAALYAGWTLIAAAAQPAGVVDLFRQWLAVTGERVSVSAGVPGVHRLLDALGLRSWGNPASLLVLACLAAWVWRRRDADPWLLLGVAAIVARIWVHSRTYDDALLLLPTIAVWRRALAREGNTSRWVVAVPLAAWAALLTPTWAFYSLAPPVISLLQHGLALLWLLVLAFLVHAAETQEAAKQHSGQTPFPDVSRS